MFEDVDWSHTAQHMWDQHGIRAAEADEALDDPERVVITPDYNSRSGRSSRVIGYSRSAGAVLSIIVLADQNGAEYGVNGWQSNAKDQQIYLEGGW